MNWAILLLLLVVGGVIFYAWRRNVRSLKQFVDATKTDIARLSPNRQAVPPVAVGAPLAEEQIAAAYAARRRAARGGRRY